MSKRLGETWRDIRDALSVWGAGLAVLVIGLIVAYQFVGPAPPSHIILATGAEGGAYRLYGEKLAASLASEGIEVELRETAGAAENLDLLENDATVDLGFVQGGLADSSATQRVVTLGSMYFEPLWVFVRAGTEIADIRELAGKRIAIGAVGSGTRAVALRLLALNGLTPDNAQLLESEPGNLVADFESKAIDAAILIGAPDSEQILHLVNAPAVSMLGLRRADAYVRFSPYFSKVTLPEGVLDMANDRPPDDVVTIAVTAMLAAKEDLHPALADLLLASARDVFGDHSLLAEAGQFPTPRYTDLPLAESAKRFYEYGSPFLTRYLPFWAATLVGRLWVLLLPFVGLAIPLGKLLPPVYRWRIRRRLLRRYAALDTLDPFTHPLTNQQERDRRLKLLARLDHESAGEIVPSSYFDDVYKLRRDIDLVRRRLLEGMETASASHD